MSPAMRIALRAAMVTIVRMLNALPRVHLVCSGRLMCTRSPLIACVCLFVGPPMLSQTARASVDSGWVGSADRHGEGHGGGAQSARQYPCFVGRWDQPCNAGRSR